MGRARAAVGRKRGRHLGDPQILKRRLDHHFAGELHAGRGQAQVLDCLTVETAQSAVKIAQRALEKQPAEVAGIKTGDPSRRARPETNRRTKSSQGLGGTPTL